ncbi:hypothetical protein [Aliidongia dinghuensis]|nr:hypothetical protein [Aliidongia dinghuensis]
MTGAAFDNAILERMRGDDEVEARLPIEAAMPEPRLAPPSAETAA